MRKEVNVTESGEHREECYTRKARTTLCLDLFEKIQNISKFLLRSVYVCNVIFLCFEHVDPEVTYRSDSSPLFEGRGGMSAVLGIFF